MSTHPSVSSESWDSNPQPIQCLPLEENNPNQYKSVLTAKDLRTIHGYYFILSEFDIELAHPDDRVHCPLPSQLGIYEDSLKVGLRFPLHPFVVKLMIEYNFCPSQIASNSW